MIDLNDVEEIKKLDPKDVYSSTGLFADQAQQILDEYFDVDFYDGNKNPGHSSVQNIVIAGMGGSAYGGYVAQTLFEDSFKLPLLSHNDYGLPGFVNENSLIMTTSYSGSTEEVLSAFEEAKKRGAKITGFSSGGKLGELLKDYPGFAFDAKNNPSGQPRLGTGYMVTATIVLLNALRVINVSKQELQQAIDEVRNSQDNIKQQARELAQKLQGSIPVIFAAEHLEGNAHILRNQFNETAKSFSAFSDLPELNHHLMEGLKNPQDKKLHILFLNSLFYSEKHKKRVELTQDVVGRNDVEFSVYKPSGSTKLSQVYNTLSFGGYITLYLALLYGQDPSVIPWVDYFKEQLSK